MHSAISQQLLRLEQLFKEQDELYRNYAAGIGFPEAAFWVMFAVYTFEQPCTQQDLCSAWFYSKQTIHSAVGKLCRDGYVRLAPVPGARNRKAILLTAQGEAFCRASIQPLMDAEQRAFRLLSAEDRDRLLCLFERHTQNLRAQIEEIAK